MNIRFLPLVLITALLAGIVAGCAGQSALEPDAGASDVTVSALPPIPSLSPAPEPTPSPTPQKRTIYTQSNYFTLIQNEDAKAQLHRPSLIDEDKKYPVFIFLHGYGNENQTEYHPEYFGWVKKLIQLTNENPDDYEAYTLIPITPGWGPSPKAVMYYVDLMLQEEAVDPDRIYIAGLSMGGIQAVEFFKEYPDTAAAAVLICGSAELTSEQAQQLVDLPIRMYHSDDDDDVPVGLSRSMSSSIQEAGGELVEYNELTGYKHAIWDYVYRTDILEWLFAHSKQ